MKLFRALTVAVSAAALALPTTSVASPAMVAEVRDVHWTRAAAADFAASCGNAAQRVVGTLKVQAGERIIDARQSNIGLIGDSVVKVRPDRKDRRTFRISTVLTADQQVDVKQPRRTFVRAVTLSDGARPTLDLHKKRCIGDVAWKGAGTGVGSEWQPCQDDQTAYYRAVLQSSDGKRLRDAGFFELRFENGFLATLDWVRLSDTELEATIPAAPDVKEARQGTRWLDASWTPGKKPVVELHRTCGTAS